MSQNQAVLQPRGMAIASWSSGAWQSLWRPLSPGPAQRQAGQSCLCWGLKHLHGVEPAPASLGRSAGRAGQGCRHDAGVGGRRERADVSVGLLSLWHTENTFEAISEELVMAALAVLSALLRTGRTQPGCSERGVVHTRTELLLLLLAFLREL